MSIRALPTRDCWTNSAWKRPRPRQLKAHRLMRGKTPLIPVGKIDQLIFLVRGHRVMLDRDLAALYSVQTRVLNQAVRRHLDRFPDDFLFSLACEEVMSISQIVTSSEIKFSKHVFAFTEEIVAMLSRARTPRLT